MVDYTLEGVDLKGMTLNRESAEFKAFTLAAREGGLSQAQYARLLNFEVGRQVARASAAPPAVAAAPTPAPGAAPAPAKVEGWDKMTSFQRMAHAVAASDAARAARGKP
jgi:hypothetical protein